MTAPSVFTIPAGLSFVDTLAYGVIDDIGADPLALSDCLILLPNRRACRALREGFLRVTDGRPLLLPEMRPIGETDEDELLLSNMPPEEGTPLAPAMPPLRRQLLLTRMIRDQSPATGKISLEHATHLAANLCKLLDQVQTESLDFDKLKTIVPDRYAEHWQKTLELLSVITDRWPEKLASEGCVDPAERRNLLLHKQIAAWKVAPTERRIIAAGSTGSIPAVAELLCCVAELPNGTVVLPAFDTFMDDNTATAAMEDQTHPQFGMLRLLQMMELPQLQVRNWPLNEEAERQITNNAERRKLISQIMRPASTTDTWRELPTISKSALAGLDRVDCAGEAEEAKVIALALRQSLQNPGQTAALVTPDRNLARRVASELRRWDIKIDDSAGVPLAETPPGLFLKLVAEMVAKNFAPVSTLAALKHPFACCGSDRNSFRRQVRQWEIEALRGPRPEPGLEGLMRSLPADMKPEMHADARSLLHALKGATNPFANAMSSSEIPIGELLTAHIAAAVALSADPTVAGETKIWEKEAGETLAEFIIELDQAAAVLGPIDPEIYPALFSTLMNSRVVRPHYGRHPRLNIWGPLEARLQDADFLILGGMNEGNWPRDPNPDPWLSRPMQTSFGMPLPERRIGLAAHDFATMACANNVLMTRAEKSSGSPTVPSRWLARMQAVLMASDCKGSSGLSSQWLLWERALDKPDRDRRIRPPTPCPPLHARPRKLSVTRIETWMRDPYAIYARHILGLRPLDQLEADPAAADRGNIIHEILDRFIQSMPGDLPADAEQQLTDIGQDVFQSVAGHPVVKAFWWPRFLRVAVWFIEVERQRRHILQSSSTEVRGTLTLPAPAGDFTLTAVADRIDYLAEGGYTILDYKTGAPPTDKDIKNGFAPQLPLEAAIASAGGFEGLGPNDVTGLAFWRLSGGAPAGAIRDVKGNLEKISEEARDGVLSLVSSFDNPETPYNSVPDNDHAPRFNDYAHLARIAEWAGLLNED